MIRYETNNSDLSADEERLAVLMVSYAETGDPETETEIIALHDRLSRFRPNCPVCIAARRLAINGLSDLKNGDIDAALAKMKGSLKSAHVKWSMIKARFGR